MDIFIIAEKIHIAIRPQKVSQKLYIRFLLPNNAAYAKWRCLSFVSNVIKETDKAKDTVIMGTVGYVAPEQLGLSQSDARTDIYAVGVLLNVMLTGKHPTEVFAPGRAGKIVRKCTALNPADRYQSAARLRDAL